MLIISVHVVGGVTGIAKYDGLPYSNIAPNKYTDPLCYSDSSHLAGTSNNQQLHVHLKNECLLTPIMNNMLPFHASKNNDLWDDTMIIYISK